LQGVLVPKGVRGYMVEHKTHRLFYNPKPDLQVKHVRPFDVHWWQLDAVHAAQLDVPPGE